jgi:thymidylate kinase
MMYLIILRGPMGSGKSAIGRYLNEVLEDSILLDLDLNANGPVQDINNALGKKIVLAELYHGNSHTTDPKWIKEFQNRGYVILSVILNASLETHVSRLAKRSDNRNRDEIEYHYRKFHDELKFNFSGRAEIEETLIDTGKREIQEIGEQILNYLSLMTTSSKRA